jgi:uncharacterized protein (UPF0335 family)
MVDAFREYADNITNSKIRQLVEEVRRLNSTLNEVLQNRSEINRGLPGKGGK